jgi:phenylpyruvate tautomerase PptA (4-oxalocrotonate tautomerase family)
VCPAGRARSQTSSPGGLRKSRLIRSGLRPHWRTLTGRVIQIITEHAGENLLIDPAYLGITRSPDCILIQITLNEGRTVEQKRAFYKAVADGLHLRLQLRREDVFINLVEVRKENWSFGNGEAQYAK